MQIIFTIIKNISSSTSKKKHNEWSATIFFGTLIYKMKYSLRGHSRSFRLLLCYVKVAWFFYNFYFQTYELVTNLTYVYMENFCSFFILQQHKFFFFLWFSCKVDCVINHSNLQNFEVWWIGKNKINVSFSNVLTFNTTLFRQKF